MDISKGRYWDKPWSLVDGCTPCSPGCEHCWSAAMTYRFKKEPVGILTEGKAPRFTGYIQTHPDRLSIPLRTRKPTVFAIWNDWAHEAVTIDFQKAMLHVAMAEPQHTLLALTKRPQNAALFFEATEINPPQNWWTGCTVCNQQEADEKVPELLKVPGNKWLSIEPMLGPISLLRWLPIPSCSPAEAGVTFGLVILGGETGPGARPMHPDWVRSVRDQCRAAGVAFYFKQWGEWLPTNREEWDSWKFPHQGYIAKDLPPGHLPGPCDANGCWGPEKLEAAGCAYVTKVGHKTAGRLLEGKEHNELPWRKP